MSNKVYIKKTLVEDHSFSEIDFDLNDEFGFNYDDHDDLVEIVEGHGDADTYPIKIDRMIEALTALKNLGATHVELDYHCDHIGYEISGFEIRLATEDEVKIYTDAEEAKKAKAAKRQDLLRQLHELDNKNVNPSEGYPF